MQLQWNWYVVFAPPLSVLTCYRCYSCIKYRRDGFVMPPHNVAIDDHLLTLTPIYLFSLHPCFLFSYFLFSLLPFPFYPFIPISFYLISFYLISFYTISFSPCFLSPFYLLPLLPFTPFPLLLPFTLFPFSKNYLYAFT